MCGGENWAAFSTSSAEEVGEVGDRRALHGGGGQLPYLHARVVLDFGDGRADHVGQRDGGAPGAARGGSGEDDQAFRVPPHAGREVVEAEEVAEFVRVLGPAFHGVEEAELTVYQDLAAAGEVDEDPGDPAGEFRAFGGGAQGCPVHRAERLGDLSGLVLGGRSFRRLGEDVDLLAEGAVSAWRAGVCAGRSPGRCCAG